jgi:hypothetical protein
MGLNMLFNAHHAMKHIVSLQNEIYFAFPYLFTLISPAKLPVQKFQMYTCHLVPMIWLSVPSDFNPFFNAHHMALVSSLLRVVILWTIEKVGAKVTCYDEPYPRGLGLNSCVFRISTSSILNCRSL